MKRQKFRDAEMIRQVEVVERIKKRKIMQDGVKTKEAKRNARILFKILFESQWDI